MEKKINLYIDMDGCLAEFTLLEKENMHLLYEEGYFRDLKPQQNVIDGVILFIRNHPNIEVAVLSAFLRDSKYALKEKQQWLDKHIPQIDAGHRYFVPCGASKAVVASNDAHAVLLDDHSPNLLDWVKQEKNVGIKLLNGINGKGQKWKGMRISKDLSPQGFAKTLYQLVENSQK